MSIGMLFGSLHTFIEEQREIHYAMQRAWKNRLIREWEKTKELPRKKKKMARKRILLEWGLASFDIFDTDSLFNINPSKKTFEKERNEHHG